MHSTNCQKSPPNLTSHNILVQTPIRDSQKLTWHHHRHTQREVNCISFRLKRVLNITFFSNKILEWTILRIIHHYNILVQNYYSTLYTNCSKTNTNHICPSHKGFFLHRSIPQFSSSLDKPRGLYLLISSCDRTISVLKKTHTPIFFVFGQTDSKLDFIWWIIDAQFLLVSWTSQWRYYTHAKPLKKSKKQKAVSCSSAAIILPM